MSDEAKKHKRAVIVSCLFIIASIMFLFIALGYHTSDEITIEQVVKRSKICFAVLAFNTAWVSYLYMVATGKTKMR